MPDPDLPTIDLATASHWRGLHPGMTREEAIRAVEEAGGEISEDETDPEWLAAMWDDTNFELLFASEGAQVLREITMEDEAGTWAGKPLIDVSLDRALAAIGRVADDAKWRPECAIDERFADLEPLEPGVIADEALLREGTVWLPQRNLGLVVCEGDVFSIVWRRPEDFPRQFAGPVTESQKQIAGREDCADYLREHSADAAVESALGKANPAQNFILLAFILTIGWLGWQAFEESRLWHTAPEITGTLTQIVETPNQLAKQKYRVSYTDAEGRAHTADLEPGEFYVPPTAIGEEVKLAYVAGDPPRVMGLSRVRDAAFIRYVPWFIAVTAGYAILSFALRFLSRLRRTQEAVPVSPVLPTNTGRG